MSIERFRWLAAAIAAHPEGKVVGRIRLQKEIKLLQRLKFPTDYSYTIHFYGPYSAGLHAEIGLLEALGLAKEEQRVSQDSTPYYILEAQPGAERADSIKPFQQYIDRMADADPTVLELAATYDMFRATGSDHNEATARLRRKKGSKCDGGNERKALELLNSLGLQTA
jgi:uncharacterized protein YwgA